LQIRLGSAVTLSADEPGHRSGTTLFTDLDLRAGAFGLAEHILVLALQVRLRSAITPAILVRRAGGTTSLRSRVERLGTRADVLALALAVVVRLLVRVADALAVLLGRVGRTAHRSAPVLARRTDGHTRRSTRLGPGGTGTLAIGFDLSLRAASGLLAYPVVASRVGAADPV